MSSLRIANRRFPVRQWLAAAALLAAVGCGPGTGDLSGKVSYKDKPLHSGTVLVIAADGSSLSGPIQDDGSYSILGVPNGTASIGVVCPDPKSMVIATRKEKGAPKSEVVRPEQSKWFPIPDKYSDAKGSGMTTTVKSGKNDFPIDLK